MPQRMNDTTHHLDGATFNKGILYMRIHVLRMLAIGIDECTQQTNKQPQWLF